MNDEVKQGRDYTGEIKNGLWAKMMMARERGAITRTIGEIFDRKMRGAPVDAADLYKKVGGESEFTYRLFAETFGSESGKCGGLISSDPAEDTPIDKVNAALAEVAQKLAAERVPNVTGNVTGLRTVDVNSVVIEGDYVCIKIGLTAGTPAPWPDDPFVGGPTTWVFGASKRA